ncbi:hypothetical protein CYY_005505 [Polysphondylium violaceum]|uniref:Leucine-rich repeat-containing protein n=1 Tax=Polysphondylium violaceum TaxID=133409 RepID=A0A8J4PRR3_9MYCE|nr:hypothetical protein CYY_005505 [Polysphondylium violaceum]
MNPFCFSNSSIYNSFSFNIKGFENQNNNNNNNNNQNNNNNNNNGQPIITSVHHYATDSNKFTAPPTIPIKQKRVENINELPKFLLVEILKHLNNSYSCAKNPLSPQNPFFHNSCYSDQLTNGKDSNDSKKIRRSNNNLNTNKELQQPPQQQPQQPPQQQQYSTKVYLNEMINLALVCKYWAKCIVPVSIINWIKITNRKEMLAIMKLMTKGIIRGGLPCQFSIVKFQCKKTLQPKPVQSSICTYETSNAITACTGIRDSDYKTLLEQCPNIRTLCFGPNQLNLQDITVISNYLKVSSNIVELKINNCFCLDGFKVFTDALKHNQSITALDISFNYLTRECIVALVNALKHNQAVTFLDLSFASIGSNGVYLVDLFKFNCTLKSVFLIGNELDNDSISAISESLAKNQSITELSLSENEFDDDIGSSIGEVFLTNKSIKTLDLSFNDLADCTLGGFSESLLDNRCNLRSLNLSDCSMSTGNAGVQFFQALQSNKTLEKLIMWSCDLSSMQVKEELATCIRLNTSLTELSLGFNDLVCDDVCLLVHKGLKYNKTITNISFNNNYIKSVGGIILAEHLRTNSSIREFSLFDNLLENIAAIEFLISLTQNNSIQKICLGSNRICPNISGIFRPLLKYNQPVPIKRKPFWVKSKFIHFRSEIIRITSKMTINYSSKLGNSLKQLFKILNINNLPNNNDDQNNSNNNSSNNTYSNSSSSNNSLVNSCNNIDINSLNLSSSNNRDCPSSALQQPSPLLFQNISHNNNNNHGNQNNNNLLCSPTFNFNSSPVKQVSPTSPPYTNVQKDFQDQLIQIQSQLQMELHNVPHPTTNYYFNP